PQASVTRALRSKTKESALGSAPDLQEPDRLFTYFRLRRPFRWALSGCGALDKKLPRREGWFLRSCDRPRHAGLAYWPFSDATCASRFPAHCRDNDLRITGVLKNSPPMPPNCRRNLFVCAREERFACVRRALLASPALGRQVYGKSRPAADRVAPHCFVNINT